ncbi:hypothetical protein [Schlesneria sp. DSM 10557]|uniref:hypothetical protein n=1 Tax=Schlesneria sp. DSM 10557 TaxID=3044399 RepID=UPI0035A0097B
MDDSESICPDHLHGRMELISERVRTGVFLYWCLQREAVRGWNFFVLLTPIFLAGVVLKLMAATWYPGLGIHLQRALWGVAAFSLVLGSIRHVSGAVCWEVSDELNDLVKLTGIDPVTLIFCKSLCRWLTILLSLLLLVPLWGFVLTMGPLDTGIAFAAVSWLFLLTVLMSGFALISSVSSKPKGNPDRAAAVATLAWGILYNFLFGFAGAVMGFLDWHQGMVAMINLTPIVAVTRTLIFPGTFSCLDISYWLHLMTGSICIWRAVLTMQRRFRVTIEGNQIAKDTSEVDLMNSTPHFMRPRCTDRPLRWKDQYILGGGNFSRSCWRVMAFLILIGVVLAIAKGEALVTGIAATCLFILAITVRFDALVTAEFRHQTWNSLMLLPSDPMQVIVEKFRAAVWEFDGLLIPLLCAVMAGTITNPTAMMMVLAIALLFGVLLMQISVITQLYSRNWWAGPSLLLLFIVLIFIIISSWLALSSEVAFSGNLAILIATIVVFHWQVRWKLNTWSDE